VSKPIQFTAFPTSVKNNILLPNWHKAYLHKLKLLDEIKLTTIKIKTAISHSAQHIYTGL